MYPERRVQPLPVSCLHPQASTLPYAPEIASTVAAERKPHAPSFCAEYPPPGVTQRPCVVLSDALLARLQSVAAVKRPPALMSTTGVTAGCVSWRRTFGLLASLEEQRSSGQAGALTHGRCYVGVSKRLAGTVAHKACRLLGRGASLCCRLHEQVPLWLRFLQGGRTWEMDPMPTHKRGPSKSNHSWLDPNADSRFVCWRRGESVFVVCGPAAEKRSACLSLCRHGESCDGLKGYQVHCGLRFCGLVGLQRKTLHSCQESPFHLWPAGITPLPPNPTCLSVGSLGPPAQRGQPLSQDASRLGLSGRQEQPRAFGGMQ